MKRQNYQISIDGQSVATKHAWNSAMAGMRAAVRDSLAPGEQAEIETKEIDRPDKWTFRSGVFTWRVTPTQRTIHAEIQLLNP